LFPDVKETPNAIFTALQNHGSERDKIVQGALSKAKEIAEKIKIIEESQKDVVSFNPCFSFCLIEINNFII
jgi:hypothetical protein